jgi:TonB family protein
MMKTIAILSFIGLLSIYSCAPQRYLKRNEIPQGAKIIGDSLYYNGYLERMNYYHDSIKIVSKSWKFKGKDLTVNGVPVDPYSKDGFVPVTKQPSLLKTVPPDYPENARREGVEGEVWVKIWVDEGGVPRLITVLNSSNTKFNRSALIAGMNWRFTPAEMDNRPVGVFISLPFKYKLN